jgi:hypothetical protein
MVPSTHAQVVGARGVLFVTEAASFSGRTKQTIETLFNDKTWPEIRYGEAFSAATDPQASFSPGTRLNEAARGRVGLEAAARGR